ncbi:MAG TPA: hypothetical protein VGM82_24820 [Gemmatimonadaceae bacterium]|jgi:hypothetical protein
MARGDDVRAAALSHGQQIESKGWLGVPALAARWNVSRKSVRNIPREQLPYITFGGTSVRRYKPADVEHFESTAKWGNAA